jgi:hypothetical protein
MTETAAPFLKRAPLHGLLRDGFERYGTLLALGAAFFLPLKLALAYLFLIPLNGLWLTRLLITRRFELARTLPIRALLFFLLLVSLSALFGLDPGRSVPKVIRFAFYTVTIVAFADLRGANVLRILSALLVGQTIAAMHSVISAAYPAIPQLFLGSVSESGQLGISILCGVGVAFALNRQALHFAHRQETGEATLRYLQERRHAALLGTLTFLLLLSLSFGQEVGLEGISFTIGALSVLFASLLGIVAAIQLNRLKIPGLPEIFFLVAFVLPYLGTALLVNLKRGPWLGVFVGGLVLLVLHARRYLIPLIVTAVLLVVVITPLRNRIAVSSEHFFIAGGRQVIWEIGGELSLRYPLGIGYENSPILRRFSPEIPPELVHFHNNILQILVESGWFALGVYLWWIWAVIRLACRPHRSRSESLVCAAIGCAVIAWQVAGLVEYNLGDSEVALVAFVAIGLMLKLKLAYSPEKELPVEVEAKHA